MNLTYILENFETLEDQIKAFALEADSSVFFTEKTLKQLISKSSEDIIFNDFNVFKHFVLLSENLFELTSYRSDLFDLLKTYLATYPDFSNEVVKPYFVKLVKKAVDLEATDSFNPEIKEYIIQNAVDFIKSDFPENLSVEEYYTLNTKVADYLRTIISDRIVADHEDELVLSLFERSPIIFFLTFIDDTVRQTFIQTHYDDGVADFSANYSTKLKQLFTELLIQKATDKYKEIDLNTVSINPIMYKYSDGVTFEQPYSYTNVVRGTNRITISKETQSCYVGLTDKIPFSLAPGEKISIKANYLSGPTNGYIGVIFFDNKNNVVKKEDTGEVIFKVTQHGTNTERGGEPFFKYSTTTFDVPNGANTFIPVLVHNPNNNTLEADTILNGLTIYSATNTIDNEALFIGDLNNGDFTIDVFSWISDSLQIDDDTTFLNWVKSKADKNIQEIDFNELDFFSGIENKSSLMESDGDIPAWDATSSIIDNPIQAIFFLLDETKADEYMQIKANVTELAENDYLNLVRFYQINSCDSKISPLNNYLKQYTNYFANVTSFKESFNSTDKNIAGVFVDFVVDDTTKYPASSSDWLTRNDLKVSLIDYFYNQPNVDIEDKFDTFVNIFADKGLSFFELFYEEYDLDSSHFTITGKPFDNAGKKYQYAMIKYLSLGGEPDELTDLGISELVVQNANIYVQETTDVTDLTNIYAQNVSTKFSTKIFPVIQNETIKDVIAYSLENEEYYSKTLKFYIGVKDGGEWFFDYFTDYDKDAFVLLSETLPSNESVQDFAQYCQNSKKEYKQVSKLYLETTIADIESVVFNSVYKKKNEETVYPYIVEIKNGETSKDITAKFKTNEQTGISYNLMDTFNENLSMKYDFENTITTRNIIIDFPESMAFESDINVFINEEENLEEGTPVATITTAELLNPLDPISINVNTPVQKVTLKSVSTNITISKFKVSDIQLEDNSGILHDPVSCMAFDFVSTETITQDFKTILNTDYTFVFSFDVKDTTNLALDAEEITLVDSYSQEELDGTNNDYFDEIDFTGLVEFLTFNYKVSYFSSNDLYNLLAERFNYEFSEFKRFVEEYELQDSLIFPGEIIYDPYYYEPSQPYEIQVNELEEKKYVFHYNVERTWQNVGKPLLQKEYLLMGVSLTGNGPIKRKISLYDKKGYSVQTLYYREHYTNETIHEQQDGFFEATVEREGFPMDGNEHFVRNKGTRYYNKETVKFIYVKHLNDLNFSLIKKEKNNTYGEKQIEDLYIQYLFYSDRSQYGRIYYFNWITKTKHYRRERYLSNNLI